MRKQLLTNTPINTKYQFAPGGDKVPIQVRASGLSTVGYSTQGLPGANVNKTVLGAYRMGDSDGNAPPSAIYAGDIFAPQPARDRIYKPVTFENVGNRVYQPENSSLATHALINRLGDQKFKAEMQAPFEDYFQALRLARDADEAARNAGLEDLGVSREIIRNIVDVRRKQNEADYLRKMIDSGLSAEDAQDEIENVRRARALQEARTVDDRTYQSKLLLTRLAASRGITPNVKEPLTQSAAIENPAPSQATANLIGQTGQGFGAAGLDADRQFMTPAFYRRFLRRSALTQEAADQLTAVSQLASEGQVVNIPQFDAMTRQRMLEAKKEQLASQFKRIMLPLPEVVIAKEIIEPVYTQSGKNPADSARYTVVNIQEMNTFQLLVALNQTINVGGADKAREARRRINELPLYTIGRSGQQVPNPTIRDELRVLVTELNDDDNMLIPFVQRSRQIDNMQIADSLDSFRNLSSAEFRRVEAAANSYSSQYDEVYNNPGAGMSTEEFLRPVSTSIRSSAVSDHSAVPENVAYSNVMGNTNLVAQLVANQEEEMPALERALEIPSLAQLKALSPAGWKALRAEVKDEVARVYNLTGTRKNQFDQLKTK